MKDKVSEDKLTGNQINTTAADVSNAVVGEIASKAIKNLFGKTVDTSDSQTSDNNEEFVTITQLEAFGNDLVTKLTSKIEEITKSTDTDDKDTTTNAPGDDKDDKTNVQKSADIDNDKDSKDEIDDDKIEKTVSAVLSKLGISEIPQRKSYVVTSEGQLLNKSIGDAPEGSVSIDPDEIDQETWDNLPKETREKILGQEFRNRMTPAR